MRVALRVYERLHLNKASFRSRVPAAIANQGKPQGGARDTILAFDCWAGSGRRAWSRMMRQWKPNVTVAAIAERDGQFLMVEEQTDEGLRFNQPAGHLEPGESLLEAAVREALEETGHRFVPDSLVGIYQWPRPQGDITYLRFAFGGVVASLDTDHVLDEGIVRALWLSRDELRDCADRHRSPLVMQCVEDWCAGKRHDLSLIRHYAA